MVGIWNTMKDPREECAFIRAPLCARERSALEKRNLSGLPGHFTLYDTQRPHLLSASVKYHSSKRFFLSKLRSNGVHRSDGEYDYYQHGARDCHMATQSYTGSVLFGRWKISCPEKPLSSRPITLFPRALEALSTHMHGMRKPEPKKDETRFSDARHGGSHMSKRTRKEGSMWGHTSVATDCHSNTRESWVSTLSDGKQAALGPELLKLAANGRMVVRTDGWSTSGQLPQY